MSEIKDILFPEEVEKLTNFYRQQMQTMEIEALLSTEETNKWLIGKMLPDGGFHVIAEFKKFDEKLRVL